MVTATRSQESPLPISTLLPPPPNLPPLRILAGFEDEDEFPDTGEDMDVAECDRGCDWSDGPLAPQGCRW